MELQQPTIPAKVVEQVQLLFKCVSLAFSKYLKDDPRECEYKASRLDETTSDMRSKGYARMFVGSSRHRQNHTGEFACDLVG